MSITNSIKKESILRKWELKLENINLISIEDEIKKLVQTGLSDIEEMVKYI